MWRIVNTGSNPVGATAASSWYFRPRNLGPAITGSYPWAAAQGLRKIGLLPISTQLQAFYNADGPKDSSDWKLRFQVQFPARLCYMKPSRSINITVLIVLTATLLAGCASAPSAPPVPITDMRQIEGKWEGLITLGFGGPQERYYHGTARRRPGRAMGPELAVGQGHAELQRCNLCNLRVLRTHERHADLLRRAGWALHGVGSLLQQLVGERHSSQVSSPTWGMTSALPHPAPTV